jgi:hypothetical protein
MNGAPVSVRCFGKGELRGGVRAMVTEGEMTCVEVNEEIREDEDPDQGDAGEDDDEEKVRLVGWTLLDFHKK